MGVVEADALKLRRAQQQRQKVSLRVSPVEREREGSSKQHVTRGIGSHDV